jgi:hypothetical protein
MGIDMATHADRLGDALLSVIDTAEQENVPYDEILEALESAIEAVKEMKAEREDKDRRS